MTKIIIRLTDGRLDGREFAADSASGEVEPAVLLYRLSDYGTPGKQFCFMPPEDAEAIRELGWDGAIEAGYEGSQVSYVVTGCTRRSWCIVVDANHISANTIHIDGGTEAASARRRRLNNTLRAKIIRFMGCTTKQTDLHEAIGRVGHYLKIDRRPRHDIAPLDPRD